MTEKRCGRCQHGLGRDKYASFCVSGGGRIGKEVLCAGWAGS